MTEGRFDRNAALYGEVYPRALDKTVAIFGLGGVGGYALEGLARYGIRNFILIDGDKISITNINRQILALSGTVGQSKVDAAAERIMAINPETRITKHEVFIKDCTEVDLKGVDFVIDAVDTVTAKLAIISTARALNIDLISAMGCANRLDPAKLKIGYIEETANDPLCRVMRRELRAKGISGVRVIFSTENPIKLSIASENGRHIPASGPFVPAVAGLMIAAEVINILNTKS